MSSAASSARTFASWTGAGVPSAVQAVSGPSTPNRTRQPYPLSVRRQRTASESKAQAETVVAHAAAIKE
ncbi:hypothetical protein GCM10010452_66910 [Crossiella cryophila]